MDPTPKSLLVPAFSLLTSELYLELSDLSEIWQATWQHYCRYTCQILKWYACPVTLKFDRHLGSTAADVPVQCWNGPSSCSLLIINTMLDSTGPFKVLLDPFFLALRFPMYRRAKLSWGDFLPDSWTTTIRRLILFVHKISWSLHAARCVFRIVWSLWKLTGNLAALLPGCLEYK